MDIQKILTEKIDRLPPGEHLNGFRAVRLHVDAAIRHLVRGQADTDESAFTDAIYRCNQAFEGSVKEAYRVLAGKSPEKKTPAEIETFILSSNLLRRRVLDQLGNYRREWRNPSTHDYMLDFDEDEALLAIVSVSAFAIVLCDQIDSKLAFANAEANAPVSAPIAITGSLVDAVAEKVRQFAASFKTPMEGPPMAAYSALEGALAGFLSAEFSKIGEIKVQQNAGFQRVEVDVLVSNGIEKVPIEVKLVRQKSAAHIVRKAIQQVGGLSRLEDVAGSVILVFSVGEEDYGIFEADKSIAPAIKIITTPSLAAQAF